MKRQIKNSDFDANLEVCRTCRYWVKYDLYHLTGEREDLHRCMAKSDIREGSDESSVTFTGSMHWCKMWTH